MPDPTRQVDAARFPAGWMAPGAAHAADWPARREALRPFLGTPQHIHDQETFWFVTRAHGEQMLFPKAHRLSGRDRYDWEPHPDLPGLELGYLKAEAAA